MSVPHTPLSPHDLTRAPVEEPVSHHHAYSHSGRVIAALMLIVVGLIFLVGNLNIVSGGLIGAWLIAGLGAAFLLARVATGRYGHAVPAGILLASGAYMIMIESGWLIDRNGGWLNVALGFGFLGVYLIGFRPGAVWPFFPGLLLLGAGSLLLGLVDVWPLVSLAWIGAY